MSKTRPTERELDALVEVASGRLTYSTRTGCWEPERTDRWPAYTFINEWGWARERLDAEPVGRVLQLVPVDITDEGLAVLAEFRPDAVKVPVADERWEFRETGETYRVREVKGARVHLVNHNWSRWLWLSEVVHDYQPIELEAA